MCLQMSVTGATSGALLFSGATLIVSLFAAASIYSQVNSIWSELDSEMSNFKVIAQFLTFVQVLWRKQIREIF